MDVIVGRLHQCLAEALQLRGPDATDRPVTVAEIYQDLVPYRAVRERLGIEMNADYEHALVRLLAGEHGLLRLEPANAREELRQELASPNPNLGVYRKFAACDVWVDPGSAADLVAHKTGAQDNGNSGERSLAHAPVADEPAAAMVELRTAADVLADLAREITPAQHAPEPRSATPLDTDRAGAGTDAPSNCAFCAGELPRNRTVRFCPHCGQDQRRRPCSACGEVLDLAWRFCIACGTETAVHA